jgi:hypothetical protein
MLLRHLDTASVRMLLVLLLPSCAPAALPQRGGQADESCSMEEAQLWDPITVVQADTFPNGGYSSILQLHLPSVGMDSAGLHQLHGVFSLAFYAFTPHESQVGRRGMLRMGLNDSSRYYVRYEDGNRIEGIDVVRPVIGKLALTGESNMMSDDLNAPTMMIESQYGLSDSSLVLRTGYFPEDSHAALTMYLFRASSVSLYGVWVSESSLLPGVGGTRGYFCGERSVEQ